MGKEVAKCPKLGDIWAYVEDDKRKAVQSVPISGPGNKDTDAAGLAGFLQLAEGKYTVTINPLKAPVSDTYALPKKTSEKVNLKCGQVVRVTFTLRLRPVAKIEVADPKIIIVHRDYKDTLKKPVPAHRIPVKIGYDGDHDGDVILDSPASADLKVFADAKGKSALALPLTVKAKDAKSGKTVYVQASKPSGANKGTELSCELRNGSIPPKTAKATEKVTCVELKLETFKARPLTGAEPATWGDDKRIKPGRSLIVQDATNLWSQRAKFVMHKAKPADFPGKIKIVPINATVGAYADEKAVAGQAAITGAGLEFANPAVDAAKGQVFWIQAESKSAAFGDTGWTVEASDVPGEEGDRVTMSGLEMDLRIYKSTPAKKKEPEEIAKGDKLPKGRYVHKQDANNLHGRAKLVIGRLEPPGFDGQVFLTCWDIQTAPASEAKSGSPKLKLFDAETAGGEQAFETNIPHPAGAKKDLKTLWVEGTTNSGALRDSQIRLGVLDVCHANDRAAFTVVEFTKIKATIKSTPALNARPGTPAPVDHTFENSAKYWEDFSAGKNPPLVIVRNGRDDIALEVTTIPAAPIDLDILWRAVRNTADHKSLGGEGDLPTVTRDPANKRKATLQCNQKGSFHIRPYIDCNGVDEYSPKEPSIPLNLVLADAKFVRDNSAGFKRNLTSALAPGAFNVSNGAWPGSWAASIAANGAGMTMELIADVTGGGADGRLGLDSVFGGLVNMLTDNQIRLTYTDIITAVPVGGAAATLTVRNLYVLNLAAATGNYGTKKMFKPTDPAPNILAFPVLDTGRPNGGLGGESATMTRSGPWDLQANRPVGIRYTLRCIDSPGRGFLLSHPSNANSRLTGIHYVQAFRANFCFWTNNTQNRGTTGDPCDRVYSVIRTMNWEAHGDWTIAWNNVAAVWTPTLTNTTPHDIQITNPATVNPIGAADRNGVEVRPPSGITSAIAWVTT